MQRQRAERADRARRDRRPAAAKPAGQKLGALVCQGHGRRTLPQGACVKRLVSHVAGLWGRRWFLPLVPALYALFLLAMGDLRPEHVAFAAAAALSGMIGPRGKQFFVDCVPAIAVAFGYDLVRYARPLFVSPERVLGC